MTHLFPIEVSHLVGETAIGPTFLIQAEQAIQDLSAETASFSFLFLLIVVGVTDLEQVLLL